MLMIENRCLQKRHSGLLLLFGLLDARHEVGVEGVAVLVEELVRVVVDLARKVLDHKAVGREAVLADDSRVASSTGKQKVDKNKTNKPWR